jgi:nicotinamide-nucleotide amidase
MVRLRLTALGEDRQSLEALMRDQFKSLKEKVAAWMVTDENISLPQALGKLLRAKGKTVGTAESCTGGYIAHLLTAVPGSSDYFKGSIVSYSNEVKKDLLEVSQASLEGEGAVSQQTVEQMAKGALKVLKTDYVMATSGIMGPDGGTEQKPVGTAWVAAASKEGMLSRKFFFRFDRERNIELTAASALNLLRELMLA